MAVSHQSLADCHLLRSGSSPDFLNLRPSPFAVQHIFLNMKSKSKWIPKNMKIATFSQQKCRIFCINPVQIQRGYLTHFTMHGYGVRVGLGIPQITQARPWVSHRAAWARIVTTICDSANPVVPKLRYAYH